MPTPTQLPIQKIKDRFSYDPATGIFTRKTPSPTQEVGSTVKPGSHGYCRIVIDGNYYTVHRAAWAIVYGDPGDQFIDHIDGNRSNNAINNLRIASQQINTQNRRKANSNNRHGLLGAHLNKKQNKFSAQIRVNGKNIHIGSFNTAHDAHLAYIEAKRRMHEGCTI